jgi:hypothetical protein
MAASRQRLDFCQQPQAQDASPAIYADRRRADPPFETMGPVRAPDP